MLILQRRGRATAAQLAAELEVSRRTVLRDIEDLSGAGVPVYAVRGPGGGFELLEGFDLQLPDPARWEPASRRPGAPRRATIRISPQGRRLAAVLGVLQPLRIRGARAAGAVGAAGAAGAADQGWVRATFRISTLDAAAADLLSLSPEVEALEPPALRDLVADRLRLASALYAEPEVPQASERPVGEKPGSPDDSGSRG